MGMSNICSDRAVDEPTLDEPSLNRRIDFVYDIKVVVQRLTSGSKEKFVFIKARRLISNALCSINKLFISKFSREAPQMWGTFFCSFVRG